MILFLIPKPNTLSNFESNFDYDDITMLIIIIKWIIIIIYGRDFGFDVMS